MAVTQNYERSRNKNINFDKVAAETYFTKTIDTFNKNFIEMFRHNRVKSQEPIIIIGMPRSATTLTEQIIASHPKVLAAGEVDYWVNLAKALPIKFNLPQRYPECVMALEPQQVERIAESYLSTLHKITGQHANPLYITDKMPHNFLHLGLIATVFPNAKIIHTKRDPIDTCLSIYFQNFSDSHAYAFDLNNLGFYYKQYELLMEHWHTLFPGRILDLNYSDTIADPEYWTRKLISHLGLEWDDACLAPHKLERSVRTASHWQIRQPIYKSSVARWKNYEAYIQPLISVLNTAADNTHR